MNKHNLIIGGAIFATLAFFSCGGDETKSTEKTFADPLITHRDTTVNPAVDFFHYANGGWFKQNPIPATDKSNGIFKTIDDTINDQVRRVCQSSAADKTAPKGSNKQKIGDFYSSGMDTAAIEKAGLSPLKEEMDRIDAIKDIPALLNTIAWLQSRGTDPCFNFFVAQDDKISTKYALQFGQGGLGLGQRDYYFLNDPATKKIRNEYVEHVTAMLKLSGQSEKDAAANAEEIMKIEMDFAAGSRNLEELRDPQKNYNKMSVEAFSKITPSVNWKEMLEIMGVKNPDSVIVGQPEFFTAFGKALKKHDIERWKTYLKWDQLNSYADFLNKDIERQNFKFYSTILTGITAQKPRWERVVSYTNKMLGELIGQVYVAEYLPKGSKEKLLEIGNNIRDVYREHLKNLDWMHEETKQKALAKLEGIVMKVGYPDKWKDLSSLEIEPGSYCLNVKRCSQWNYNYTLARYGKPVDRTVWNMFPQTYNAYYNPANNEIVVPACNIIVPGFEGRMPDDAILYGIIGGSTFGHEITHGFDDSGSQYDVNGNLNNWWTPEDKKKFVAKTRLIVKQFSKFKVLDSIHVNGEATQGENIADLGGVVMGYEAFKKTPQYKNNEIISGLTPDQRYFLAYGYAWMVNIKKESLARQIMIDVHSPAQFRINGPLANLPEFYKTFNVKEGDPMYQPDSLRVMIW